MSDRIFVVEPGQVIQDALRTSSWAETLQIGGSSNLARLVQLARANDLALVVLDVLESGRSSIDHCRRIRAESDVPILVLTAQDSVADRLASLEAGADDHLGKPFALAELLSRIRVALRRRQLVASRSSGSRRVGDIEIDLAGREVVIGGRPARLTPSELRLLLFLAEHPGRPRRRGDILRYVWQSEHVGDERVCDAHISNLRHKIERDPQRPERVVTVRGVGYALQVA